MSNFEVFEGNPNCNCNEAYAKGEHCNNCDLNNPDMEYLGCNCKMSDWGNDGNDISDEND